MEPVTALLVERQGQFNRPRNRAFFGFSVLLHIAMVAAFVVVPMLFANDERPEVEYVEVVAIRAADLGLDRRPEPVRREPEPAPAQPDLQPEPKPEPPPETPVLPAIKPDPPPPSRPADRPPDEGAPTSSDDRPAVEEPAQQQAASLGSGSDTRIASFDDVDFRYNYYADRMAALIRAQWNRPNAPAGIESTLKFRIQSDGAVTDLVLERSSGNSLFDRLALDAVKRASPLPPLPRGFRKPSLGVTLVVR